MDVKPGSQLEAFDTDQSRSCIVGYAQQFEAVRSSLAVVLDEMRLIENDTGPGDAMRALGISGKQIVVHDHPPRIGLFAVCNTQHLDLSVRIHHPDLSPPVEFERGGADRAASTPRQKLMRYSEFLRKSGANIEPAPEFCTGR